MYAFMILTKHKHTHTLDVCGGVGMGTGMSVCLSVCLRTTVYQSHVIPCGVCVCTTGSQGGDRGGSSLGQHRGGKAVKEPGLSQ